MRKVSLTFDNGPDPEVTPRLLDVLKQRGVQATFFVVGDKLRDRNKVAERAHADGHWIGNHTFTHIVPLGRFAEPKRAIWEIERTQQLIGDLAHERRFFRPLGGGRLSNELLSREAVEYLAAEKYTCVLWNVVPQDWIYPSSWVEKAVAMSLRQTEPCVVLHDLSTGAMDQVDRFIGTMRDNGFEFTQDFPASCIPMDRGLAHPSLESYVMSDSE